MKTRKMCNKCGEFFILGQEGEECLQEVEKFLTYNNIRDIGTIWKQKHEEGEITDNEYDAVAEAFGMLYKKLR